jgi:transforming growth factor-beta-induced protein
MIKVLKFALLGVVMAALLSACTTVTPQTIAERVAGDAQFSTLAAALEAADLVEALNGAGPFTVFAPTDAAFEVLLEELGVSAEDLLADPDLADILLYHVVSGELRADAVVAAAPTTVPTLLEGADIAVTIVNGGVKLNHRVNVTTTNIIATNGVIHVIDAVLRQPEPTIAEIASGLPDFFSILVAALAAADLVELLDDPSAGPFTVFAPTNAAFEALLDELGATAEQLLAREDLADILLYHVVPGIVMAADVVALIAAAEGGIASVTTAQGDDITIALEDEAVVINEESTVIDTDIVAWNGVIHVIDTVLLPPPGE